MKIIDSVKIPFYEFQCEDSLLNKVIEILPTLKFIEDTSNFHTDNFYDKELFEWLESCLCLVKDEIYNKNLELKISSCWINKAQKYQKTKLHYHVNSIVSGILYFSDEPSSRTVFAFQNPWFHAQHHEVLKLGPNENSFLKFEIEPKKGRLVLFPSNIKHEVSLYTGQGVRYSLAFNSFVVGNLSTEVTKRLNIGSLGV